MKRLLMLSLALLCAAIPFFAQTPSAPWFTVTSLPTAASAVLGMPYRWTQATTANTCPSAGAGGSGGSAQAGCITLDGTSWTALGGAGLPITDNGTTLSTTRNFSIGTTIPGGAPASSQAIAGYFYSGGVKVPVSFADLLTFTSGTPSASTALFGDGVWKTILSAFSAVTSGTNTVAAMVVGAGASLDFASTGTINASSLGGSAAAAYVKGAASLTTAGCLAYETSSGTVTCSAKMIHQTASDQASIILTQAPGYGFVEYRMTTNGGASGIAARFETSNKNYIYLGTAVYSTAPTGSIVSLDLTDGAVGIGNNNRPTSGTLTVKDGTATTGATRVTVAKGAADSTATNILTVEGGMTASGGVIFPSSCTGIGIGAWADVAGVLTKCP